MATRNTDTTQTPTGGDREEVRQNGGNRDPEPGVLAARADPRGTIKPRDSFIGDARRGGSIACRGQRQCAFAP